MREALFSAAALFTLTPLLLLPYRATPPDGQATADAPPLFWLALGFAIVGPAAWSVDHLAGQWSGGLSNTLWLCVAVCLALYGVLCATARWAWRLSPLLGPYLSWVGLTATATAAWPGRELRGGAPGPWIDLHIGVSVATYALLTLAATASAAAFLQQRALKKKRFTRLNRLLPSVAESDRLQFQLLAASESVLAAGLATGMAVLHFEQKALLRFDHKTLLSLSTFVVIAVLLIAHARWGLGGRIVARMVLMSYLLLTLAYPGVKFVTDVLMK